MDYKEIADQIIIAIGGQDNVKYVTHCVTRLRFVLKNKNLVNQDKINEIDGVLGSTFGAGQFQIIMGKNLSATFTQVVKNYNFEVAEIIDESLDEDIKEKDDSPIWKRGIKKYFQFLICMCYTNDSWAYCSWINKSIFGTNLISVAGNC